MIEINLLPEELRVKIKTKSAEYSTVTKPAAFSQEQLFVYAIPILLFVLVCAHIYFAVISISKNNQLVALNRKWVELAPQKKGVDEFNNEYSAVSQDASLAQLLTGKRILWAEKLNKLSLNLPSGVWFNEITINAKDIVIQGSVISFAKEEVNLINKLLENLKEDSEFSKDFVSFELSNVKKKNVGGYDIADFILTGALKVK
ncbi:MAG: PilN domain-containing protein [Candidatus Omnitrophica bacterium]|nr:PilN domain-containing protein [Candidatus Omnitrophota bacterium]MDO9572766.1 PilN domain-containing protein [Candidatus Omnitrophota bacterium]